MAKKAPPKNRIISIVGLTASGKSWLGIQLANLFNGEIISTDSRQVYKRLDIGSAKVTAEEQSMAPHHLLDIVEPMGTMDVFTFQKLAFDKIDEIHARGKTPILVGGTGLYSRSIIENYNFADKANPTQGERKYDFLQIALLPPREWLESTIAKRNQLRYEMGMINETRELLASGVDHKWLRKLGLDYQLTTEYVMGELTRTEFESWHVIRTMQYAKRQRTWFKRERDTIFLTDPDLFNNPQKLLNTAKQLTEEFIK
ncbi:MAG: hypothetical protein FWE38_00865 [Firmicutes bacterium]|nr:hypothetical protein [Bacillota bacterium]